MASIRLLFSALAVGCALSTSIAVSLPVWVRGHYACSLVGRIYGRPDAARMHGQGHGSAGRWFLDSAGEEETQLPTIAPFPQLVTPIAGGYLSQQAGWRCILWLLAILVRLAVQAKVFALDANIPLRWPWPFRPCSSFGRHTLRLSWRARQNSFADWPCRLHSTHRTQRLSKPLARPCFSSHRPSSSFCLDEK